MLTPSQIQYIETDGRTLVVLPKDEFETLLQNQAYEVPLEVQQEMNKRADEMERGQAKILTLDEFKADFAQFKDQHQNRNR